MADGKMVGSFGILSSLSFYFLLRPHTALYVLIVLMCVPTMCLRSTLSLTPVHRVHHVADFLWLNLLSTISTFPTPRPARLPPADILLSTFVDTSRPFWDCTDFSLLFRRIIIVIDNSDMFTREHGGAFFIEPFLLIYVGGHILSRIFSSCPLL